MGGWRFTFKDNSDQLSAWAAEKAAQPIRQTAAIILENDEGQYAGAVEYLKNCKKRTGKLIDAEIERLTALKKEREEK